MYTIAGRQVGSHYVRPPPIRPRVSLGCLESSLADLSSL